VVVRRENEIIIGPEPERIVDLDNCRCPIIAQSIRTITAKR
jgi:hypothetical protein